MGLRRERSQIQWSERVPAPGALSYADDRLYFHGENGTITLIEATPEGYREHGRVTPPNPPVPANQMEKAWPHPVIADGRLFVRNNESLWCYDIKHISGSAQ